MAKSQVVMEISSEDRKILQSLQKLEGRFDKLEAKVSKGGAKMRSEFNKGAVAADKMGTRLKAAGMAGRNAFGRQATDSLKTYLGTAVGIGAAVGVITKGLREANQIRKEAAASLTTGAGGLGQLLQLSGGDAREQARLAAGVRATRLETGASVEQAAALQFKLESVGLPGQRQFFAGFRKITDPSQFAESVSTLQAAFGAKNIGGPRQVANKLLAGSRVSKALLQEFGPGATIAAQTSKAIGGTGSELLGVLGILSRGLKSVDVAATQISALSDVIGVKGFGGKGIVAAVPQISAAISGLDPEQTKKFFGRKEARKGFFLLRDNLALVKQTIAEVDAAGAAPVGRGLSSTIQGLAKTGTLGTVISRDIETQRRLIRQEGLFGVSALNREAAREGVRRRSFDLGPVSGRTSRFGAEVGEFLGLDAQDITANARKATGSLDDPAINAIAEIILGLSKAVTELKDAAVGFATGGRSRLPANGDFRGPLPSVD